VAATLDGYIAHEDGSIDGFSTAGRPINDFFLRLAQFDTVVMGKHTYEFGYQYGLEPGQPAYPETGMMNYIFSQSIPEYTHDRLQVIREDPAAFLRRLKTEDGKAIWLCGGGKLAGYLLEHALIDRLILKLNPILFGRGIPLFGDQVKAKTGRLSLQDTKVYQEGLAFLNYTICY